MGIIALVDAAGSTVVKYSYDSWGNILGITGDLADTVGQINPFRYRGYYYDNETGMYYLKNRYYDPGIRRFISADSLIVVEGKLDGVNLYVYCKNNPVNYKDPTGHFFEKLVGFVSDVINEVGKVMQQLAPAYMTCGGVAVADGPLPVGDAIGIIGVGLITLGAIGATAYHRMMKSKEKAQEKVGDLDISITFKSPLNYWTADLVKGQIVGGIPLTAHQASVHVASGNSIMCRNQMATQYLIFVNGYVNAVGPERHRGGYWHYRPTRNHTGYPSIHIWYFN